MAIGSDAIPDALTSTACHAAAPDAPSVNIAAPPAAGTIATANETSKARMILAICISTLSTMLTLVNSRTSRIHSYVIEPIINDKSLKVIKSAITRYFP